MALRTINASLPLRRVWWGQLLAASLVSAIIQWSSAPSEGWRAQPSLLGLQLGGGKVSRMKEWECKQRAHSTGSCWQEKGFPGKGRENEGLQRKAKRKPHEVLFQKRTLRSGVSRRYQRALLSAAGNAAILHSMIYFKVSRKMKANISTSTNTMWGKYIVLVLVLLQGSVLQQRGQLEFN